VVFSCKFLLREEESFGSAPFHTIDSAGLARGSEAWPLHPPFLDEYQNKELTKFAIRKRFILKARAFLYRRGQCVNSIKEKS